MFDSILLLYVRVFMYSVNNLRKKEERKKEISQSITTEPVGSIDKKYFENQYEMIFSCFQHDKAVRQRVIQMTSVSPSIPI